MTVQIIYSLEDLEEKGYLLENLNWHTICRKEILAESFMREHADKIIFKLISMYQKLSEAFMNDFAYNLNWNWLCQCQKLSKRLMIKFRSLLNWYWVSLCQEIDLEFVKLNFKSINVTALLKNLFVPADVKEAVVSATN